MESPILWIPSCSGEGTVHQYRQGHCFGDFRNLIQKSGRLLTSSVVCVGTAKEVLAMARRILQAENKTRKRGLASERISVARPLSLCEGVVA